MTLMAEFIARSVIGKDEEVLADLEEASVVVAVEEIDTNTNKKQSREGGVVFLLVKYAYFFKNPK